MASAVQHNMHIYPFYVLKSLGDPTQWAKIPVKQQKIVQAPSNTLCMYWWRTSAASAVRAGSSFKGRKALCNNSELKPNTIIQEILSVLEAATTNYFCGFVGLGFWIQH